MDWSDFCDLQENASTVGEEFGVLDGNEVAALFVGIFDGPIFGAVRGGPSVVPLLDGPAVNVFSDFFVERGTEGEADAVCVDFHSDGLADGLAGEAHALEAAIANGGGLPAEQAGDVQMAVLGIEPPRRKDAKESQW